MRTIDCLCTDSRFSEYAEARVEVFPAGLDDEEELDCEPSQWEYDEIMRDLRDGVAWYQRDEAAEPSSSRDARGSE